MAFRDFDKSKLRKEAQKNLDEAWKTTAEAKNRLRIFEETLSKAERAIHIPPADFDSSPRVCENPEIPFRLQTNVLNSHLPAYKRRFAHEHARHISKDRYKSQINLPPSPDYPSVSLSEAQKYPVSHFLDPQLPDSHNTNASTMTETQNGVESAAIRGSVSAKARPRALSLKSRLPKPQIEDVVPVAKAAERVTEQAGRVDAIRQRLQASKRRNTEPTVEPEAPSSVFEEQNGHEAYSASRSASSTKESARSSTAASKSSTKAATSTSASTSSTSSAKENVPQPPPSSNQRIISPPIKRRRPRPRPMSDEQQALDSSGYRNRTRPYDSSQLKEYMVQKRRERKRLAEEGMKEEMHTHTYREIDRPTVKKYMKSKKEKQKEQKEMQKQKNSERREIQMKRMGEILQRQKKRSKIPMLQLFFESEHFKAQKRGELDIEKIRQRHEQRMQNLEQNGAQIVSPERPPEQSPMQSPAKNDENGHASISEPSALISPQKDGKSSHLVSISSIVTSEQNSPTPEVKTPQKTSSKSSKSSHHASKRSAARSDTSSSDSQRNDQYNIANTLLRKKIDLQNPEKPVQLNLRHIPPPEQNLPEYPPLTPFQDPSVVELEPIYTPTVPAPRPLAQQNLNERLLAKNSGPRRSLVEGNSVPERPLVDGNAAQRSLAENSDTRHSLADQNVAQRSLAGHEQSEMLIGARMSMASGYSNQFVTLQSEAISDDLSSLSSASTGEKSSSDNKRRKVVRHSASSLGQQLSVGLTYLDSIETSIKQVDEVDRLRQVTNAQQQAIAAAYLAKAHQMSEHSRLQQNISESRIQEAERSQNRLEQTQSELLRVLASANERINQSPPQPPTSSVAEVSQIASAAAASAATAAVLQVLKSGQIRSPSSASSPSSSSKSSSRKSHRNSTVTQSPSDVKTASAGSSPIAEQLDTVALKTTVSESKVTVDSESGVKTASISTVTHSPSDVKTVSPEKSESAVKTVSVSTVPEERVTVASQSDVKTASVSTQSESSVKTASSYTSTVPEQVYTMPESGDKSSEPIIEEVSEKSSVASSSAREHSSWSSEKHEFGLKLVSQAQKLVASDSERLNARRKLLKERMEALKTYFAVQIALIHAQKRLIRSQSASSDELRNLESKELAVNDQYRNMKKDARQSLDAISNEPEFYEQQIREIARLQALTLSQQWELEKYGKRKTPDTHRDEIESVRDTIGDGVALVKQLKGVSSPASQSAHKRRLEKRRKDAEKLLKLHKEFERQEREVQSLERKAVSAWLPPTGNVPETESGEESSKSTAPPSSSAISSTQNSPRKESGHKTSSSVSTVKPSSSSSVKDEAGTAKDASCGSVPTMIQTASLDQTIATSTAVKSTKSSSDSSSAESTSRRQSWPIQVKSQSISQGKKETTELEGRIQALKSELQNRRKVAAKLKHEYRRRTKEHLQITEESLNRQLTAYNKFIVSTQSQLSELERLNSSGHSLPRPATPPRILSPRPSLSSDTDVQRSPRKVRSPTKQLHALPSRSQSSSISEAIEKSRHEESTKTVENDDKTAQEAGQSSSISEAIETKPQESSSAGKTAENEIKTETPQDDLSSSVSEAVDTSKPEETTTQHSSKKSAEIDEKTLEIDENRSISEAFDKSREEPTSQKSSRKSPKNETSEKSKLQELLSQHSSAKETIEHEVTAKPDEPSSPIKTGPTEQKSIEEELNSFNETSSTTKAASFVPVEPNIPKLTQLTENDDEVPKEPSQHDLSLDKISGSMGLDEEDKRTENDVSSLEDETETRDALSSPRVEPTDRASHLTDALFNSLLGDSISEAIGVVARQRGQVGVIGRSQLERVLELARNVTQTSPRSQRSDGDSARSPRSPLAERFMAISPRKSPPHSPVVSRLTFDVDLDATSPEPTQEWMDDDLGLKSPTEHKSPRKLVESARFTTDVFSVVPYKKEEIGQIVDICAKSLFDRQESAPVELFGEVDDLNLSLNRETDRNYRQMIFDWCRELSGEVLKQQHQFGAINKENLWEMARKLRMGRLGRKIPRKEADLAAFLKTEVQKRLGVEGAEPVSKSRALLVSRKRLESYEELLLDEMYEEEPDWTDYEKEEQQVKVEMSEMVWKDVLDEAMDDL